MRLHKALKLRKSLIGDITNIKKQISEKNSYLIGSKNGVMYNVIALNTELMVKINELIGLKFVINEANKEIQSKIYSLTEFKALIAFWKSVNVTEGSDLVRYGDKIIKYGVHINEGERDIIVSKFQKQVDALQEEIDVYNYNTDIPWK